MPIVRFTGMLLVLSVASDARADQTILHEYVPNVNPNEAALALTQGLDQPNAIEYEGELLPAPDTHSAPSMPPMVAAPGDGLAQEDPGRRSPTFRPDRLTELEGTLSYHASFNPAIAPFKRVTSLDATLLASDRSTPVLAVADTRRRVVPVEGADASPPDSRARDRFWGDVQLDFSRGRVLPLPSVSPESRILTLRSAPALDLRIERDRADNYYVIAAGSVPGGPVRLTFLTDAPRSYFGTEVPRGPSDGMADRVPSMPAAVRARALSFAGELGLARGQDLSAVIHKLTSHFRAFVESAEPPRDSGDIFLDLSRGQKGVCRHRAYGFAITAQALGVPTRFVQNEAHSWVEVLLPERGWMRIDLGGAANGLQAHGAGDRPIYRPAEPDALPRPPAYEESYSQLRDNVSGLRGPGDEGTVGRWVPPSEAQPGTASGVATAAVDGEPAAAEPAHPRIALTVRIDQRRATVLRGGKLQVSGRVQDHGAAGVPGMRVEVSMAAEGRLERMLLGVTVTGADGYFQAAFGVPPDMSVGDYRLVVVTPGDATHGPALAQ